MLKDGGRMSWTKNEDKYLQDWYGRKTYNQMAQELNKTRNQIQHRARKVVDRYPDNPLQSKKTEIEPFSEVKKRIEINHDYYLAFTGSFEDSSYIDPYGDYEGYDEWVKDREEYDRRIGYLWQNI